MEKNKSTERDNKLNSGTILHCYAKVSLHMNSKTTDLGLSNSKILSRS
jgi:hypothetical protein